MHSAHRPYRAICFDLDGTLLPMDLDEFMAAYFKRIASYAAARGLDPERFIDALKKGTYAMMKNDGTKLNKEAFWEVFYDEYGRDVLGDFDAEAMANSFYDEDFGHIGDGFEANPDVARVMDVLAAKGYPLLLTTMPLFPLRAVRHRLNWAGVNPDSFERITHYENSKTAKPHLAYFAENLAAMGLRGEDVLMVGNNTMEDLAFMELGADAYLVTDYLLDPIEFDIDRVKHGTFSEFAEWVEELPDCENPVQGIAAGPIDQAATAAALEENHGAV